MTIKSGKVSIAILDDYLDIGRPKFARLVDHVEIVTFPDTVQKIDPEQREALIQRLHLFTVISTMCERTVPSTDVLKCLPNLKLILTTDLKNAAIDIQTCKELGIAVVGTSGADRSDWLSSEDKPPTSLDSTIQHT